MPSLSNVFQNVEARMPVLYGEPASVEYVGPEQVPVALECAYCGKVIVVDLLRWNGECYRCGGSATIEGIATALALIPSPPTITQQYMNSGTMAYTDPIVMDMSMLGGSASYPDQRLVAAAPLPAPPPAGKNWR